ncbi:MAG: DUF308 domain-containing protein [Bacteroidales bacterium]|nr:DUF308 domain-containing protein [Bacteroidales bacterium]
MFKSSKISLIIRGILFSALGILCFCSPVGTMEFFAKVAGIVIIITGTVFCILEYKAAAHSLETMRLSASVLMLVLGILIMVYPKIIAILLGSFILFEGIDFTLNTIKYRRAGAKGWWLMLLLGLAIVIFGAWSVFVPEIAEGTLSILFGIAFIGIGCASFTALAGLTLVEDYFEAAKKALEDKEDYVEAEVVK